LSMASAFSLSYSRILFAIALERGLIRLVRTFGGLIPCRCWSRIWVQSAFFCFGFISGNRCNRNPHMCRLRDRPRIYPRCVARPKWLGLGSGRFWGLLEACSFQRGAERCFKWQCVNTSRGISPRTMPFDGGSSFIPCNEFRESRELFHER
jgi:hypothetical protein